MAEYVGKVRRKRRRYAVDPCLGYYMYAASQNPSGRSAMAAQSGLINQSRPLQSGSFDVEREMNIPKACDHEEHVVQPTGCSSPQGVKDSQTGRNSEAREQNVVTVESFLRSTVSGTAIKKYSRRRAYRQLDGHMDIDKATDEQTMGSHRREPTLPASRCSIVSGDESGISPPRRRTRGTQRGARPAAQSLKERLYVASVSTHGVPEDCYAQTDPNDAEDSGRIPLRFVPISETEAEDQKNSRFKAQLVDPRKSTAMRTASLSFRIRERGFTDCPVLASTLDRLPLSKWNLPFKNGGHPRQSTPKQTTVQKQRKDSENMAHTETYCPPLQFVSFQEAEEKFKTVFQRSAG